MDKDWKWDGSYPVRCRIVDVTGQEVIPGVIGNTPEKSKPQVDRVGTANLDEDGHVRIELDNGAVLMGYECWWDAIGPVEFAA